METLKQGLPIIILFIIALNSLYLFATTGAIFSITQILGVIGIIIITILYFFINKPASAYSFMILMFLGVFGIVKFTPTYHTLTLMALTFSPRPLLFLIVGYF